VIYSDGTDAVNFLKICRALKILAKKASVLGVSSTAGHQDPQIDDRHQKSL